MTAQTANSQGFDAFKLFKNAKMPGLDLQAAMATHRKNLEVMQTAQKEVFNTVKTLSQTNMAYMKQAMDDFKSYVQDALGSRNLEEKVQTHTNQLKASFEKASSYGKEVSDILNRSRENLTHTFTQRFHEGVSEANAATNKAGHATKKAF